MKEWIDVEDELPKVPKGSYYVSVLVSAYDPVFERLCPGNGSHVEHCIYSSERGFETMGYGGKGEWAFCQIIDIVTHWMYEPYPVQIKNIENTKAVSKIATLNKQEEFVNAHYCTHCSDKATRIAYFDNDIQYLCENCYIDEDCRRGCKRGI